jgi:rubredoxin-NAD+ reductase
MRRFRCRYCSHVYDELLGDPDSGIAPGTRFEDIPEEWSCPECGAMKSDYELLE